MWLRGVQFVQEEPASAPSTSPCEPRELRQVAACTAGSMVCGWRADARPTARAARATARPVVRAVRACARPMARAARAARPVATGEVSGQRERRRTPCGEGGASVGAPDGDWRGRRERGGRQCKNRVLRQRSACALFPPLHAIPMRSRVHLRYRTGEPPGAVVHASATMDPMSRKSLILLCSSHNESTP